MSTPVSNDQLSRLFEMMQDGVQPRTPAVEQTPESRETRPVERTGGEAPAHRVNVAAQYRNNLATKLTPGGRFDINSVTARSGTGRVVPKVFEEPGLQAESRRRPGASVRSARTSVQSKPSSSAPRAKAGYELYGITGEIAAQTYDANLEGVPLDRVLDQSMRNRRTPSTSGKTEPSSSPEGKAASSVARPAPSGEKTNVEFHYPSEDSRIEKYGPSLGEVVSGEGGRVSTRIIADLTLQIRRPKDF